jgi:D-arabinose 1-dehydrogenase-like Zn-dependent alcohol dehydrogenase
MASGPEAASRATKECAGATLGDGVPTGGSFAELKAKIAAREAVVGVMGLGYVGLPLIATFHNAGFRAVGFDTSQEKVDQLNKGESYLDHLRNSRELFKRCGVWPRQPATLKPEP